MSVWKPGQPGCMCVQLCYWAMHECVRHYIIHVSIYPCNYMYCGVLMCLCTFFLIIILHVIIWMTGKTVLLEVMIVCIVIAYCYVCFDVLIISYRFTDIMEWFVSIQATNALEGKSGIPELEAKFKKTYLVILNSFMLHKTLFSEQRAKRWLVLSLFCSESLWGYNVHPQWTAELATISPSVQNVLAMNWLLDFEQWLFTITIVCQS